MQQDTAETIAVTALAWLAQQEDLMMRFLRLTGIEAASIRAAAEEPAFLAGVLTFFMQDERLVVRFAAESGIREADLARAHAALGGPQAYDRSI